MSWNWKKPRRRKRRWSSERCRWQICTAANSGEEAPAWSMGCWCVVWSGGRIRSIGILNIFNFAQFIKPQLVLNSIWSFTSEVRFIVHCNICLVHFMHLESREHSGRSHPDDRTCTNLSQELFIIWKSPCRLSTTAPMRPMLLTIPAACCAA